MRCHRLTTVPLQIKDLRPKDNKLMVLYEPISGQTLVGTSFYLFTLISKAEQRPFCRYIDVSGSEPVLVSHSGSLPLYVELILRPMQLANKDRPAQVGDLLYQVLETLMMGMGGMDNPEPFVLLNLKYKQSPQALIPFVGYFLDYPVAYSVGECRTPILQDVEEEGVQKSNCLGGEDLTIFSAQWTEDDSLSGCK